MQPRDDQFEKKMVKTKLNETLKKKINGDYTSSSKHEQKKSCDTTMKLAKSKRRIV